jgi:pyrroloquinoline quinone biosynthesis protein D
MSERTHAAREEHMESERRLRPNDVVELNPNYHFRWEEPQQAHVLLYPEGIVKLNETAASILERCGDGRSIADVAEDLSTEYSGTNFHRDVIKFLEVAHAKGWVRVKP